MAMQLVYDGECPFCSRYVRMVRLRETVGTVDLIDARQDHPAVTRLKDIGFDLNEGMALIDGEQIYFANDCITRLALLSTPSGLFNRINAAIFRSPILSRTLYPVMRFGRNLTLRLLSRDRL